MRPVRPIVRDPTPIEQAVLAKEKETRSALQRAAESCEAMIHAAAVVSLWRAPSDVFDEVNVGGLENAIAAVRQAGMSRLVYTSSFLALAPSGSAAPLNANDYQRTKTAALERAREARATGLPIVITIPGVIYGPGPDTEANLVGRMLRDHAAGRLPGIVEGGRVWSFSYVEDVADGHVRALENPAASGEYGMGGENAPQRAIFEWLRRRTGHPLPREIPTMAAWAAGWFQESRARWAGTAPLVTRGAVSIFRHDWPVDSGAAVRDLGYHVRALDEGLDLGYGDVARAAARRPGS